MNEPIQRTLRVLARLLDYPQAELQDASETMQAIIQADPRLCAKRKQALNAWCEQIQHNELLDQQAEYVALFDKGRSTSLLLFEHVHGESRDRGQAMVDLINEYAQAGLILDSRELPDYLPLFLEYLSTRDETTIGQWLGDIRHILALLTARLEERDAPHALVTSTLLALIGAEQDVALHRQTVSEEKPDHTPEALDAVWEEEAVRFHADSNQDCGSQPPQQQHLTQHRHRVQTQTVTIKDSTRPAAGGHHG